jgi:glycosyltransferase involved in cell wall biosynthesis
MEDFSLIILCREKLHLLPVTLDTLASQAGGFEVILLDGDGSPRIQEMIGMYPGLKIRVQSSIGHTLAQMMNEGVHSARGQYIQFLEPGDRYISQHGMEFLKTLIEKKPHLVYANSLNKGSLVPSDFISARSPWFLKSKLFELGGFDRNLRVCPSMDILCKLRNDRKTRAVFCGRILVDLEGKSKAPLRETCKILYRHFGLWYVIKWFFTQHRERWVSEASAFFRSAFFSGK